METHDSKAYPTILGGCFARFLESVLRFGRSDCQKTEPFYPLYEAKISNRLWVYNAEFFCGLWKLFCTSGSTAETMLDKSVFFLGHPTLGPDFLVPLGPAFKGALWAPSPTDRWSPGLGLYGQRDDGPRNWVQTWVFSLIPNLATQIDVKLAILLATVWRHLHWL